MVLVLCLLVGPDSVSIAGAVSDWDPGRRREVEMGLAISRKFETK
jgi:hypothetical protein